MFMRLARLFGRYGRCDRAFGLSYRFSVFGFPFSVGGAPLKHGTGSELKTENGKPITDNSPESFRGYNGPLRL
jgi:hypothetical protein